MRMISAAAIAAALAISVLTAPTAALADTYQSIETSTAQDIVIGMSDKFVRGVANVATGWLELPNQIRETYREEGLAVALFSGPLRGLGMTLVRTGAGALETVTFFHPMPGFYDPILTPKYVWQSK